MNIFKHNIFLYTSSSSFFPARLWPLHGLGALLSGFDIASVRVLCQRHLDTLLGEPTTFRLPANPLYHLSYCRHTIYNIY